RVGGVAWHPKASLDENSTTLSLATGGGDALVKLYSVGSTQPLAVLKGHAGRIGRIGFHPSGAYLGSASFDGTWRLWDVEKHIELLLQEGHSKEVYSLAFQDDGALVASGGLDAIGRVWDLRTGRTAMVLDGHAQAIFAIDFSPNGYQIATGSQDDTIRIWDMRHLKALHTIPAHKSSVSDVRFFRLASGAKSFLPPESESETKMQVDGSHQSSISNGIVEEEDVKPVLTPSGAVVAPSAKPIVNISDDKYQSGLYLVSSGYDGLVKIWSADDWQFLRALATDAGKVMSMDISNDGMFIASGSWNRSYQLFAGENVVM
ncbi:hypothetical protein FRC02_008451, partial [Tulasnella sp. 418]